MHYHQNHCWCSRSHWDGKVFDCTYMVTIDKFVRMYGEHGDCKEQEDFGNLLEKKSHVTDEGALGMYDMGVMTLKPEVEQWLIDNVEDNKSASHKGEKGWCMGDDEYRAHDMLSLTLFFYRRRDAMKFIKEWSSHRKPTTYLNYFKDDYRELVDGKLTKKERD